jgi:hypothetical protein
MVPSGQKQPSTSFVEFSWEELEGRDILRNKGGVSRQG